MSMPGQARPVQAPYEAAGAELRAVVVWSPRHHPRHPPPVIVSEAAARTACTPLDQLFSHDSKQLIVISVFIFQ